MCGSADKVEPTLTQQVQAGINQRMWDYYQANYKPLINRYIQNTTSRDVTDAEQKQVAGQINADVMKKAKATSLNPVANQKAMINLADTASDAQASGKATSKGRKIGQTLNIINMGRGQTTKAMAGLDEMASMSVSGAMADKERELNLEASTMNSLGAFTGTLAGAGWSARKLMQPTPKPTAS